MTDEIDQVQKLILWARRNRVVLAHLRVGNVELSIASMVDAIPLPSEAEARAGLIAQYAGTALDALKEEDDGATEEEDD